MGQHFFHTAFTPSVKAMQARMGTQDAYAGLDAAPRQPQRITAAEALFIGARDGFYQATVSETGWPYVQFRGGPKGFLKVLGPQTLGYADFRGNVQYISTGNLSANGRVALILMDYAHQRRLKVLGHTRLIDATSEPERFAELLPLLATPGYEARIERAVLIDVVAMDWNCPQHITPRYTMEELDEMFAPG